MVLILYSVPIFICYILLFTLIYKKKVQKIFSVFQIYRIAPYSLNIWRKNYYQSKKIYILVIEGFKSTKMSANSRMTTIIAAFALILTFGKFQPISISVKDLKIKFVSGCNSVLASKGKYNSTCYFESKKLIPFEKYLWFQ